MMFGGKVFFSLKGFPRYAGESSSPMSQQRWWLQSISAICCSLSSICKCSKSKKTWFFSKSISIQLEFLLYDGCSAPHRHLGPAGRQNVGVWRQVKPPKSYLNGFVYASTSIFSAHMEVPTMKLYLLFLEVAVSCIKTFV